MINVGVGSPLFTSALEAYSDSDSASDSDSDI